MRDSTRCESHDLWVPSLRLTIRYSTELNATQSPLLRLPAEIRNQIYSYIFNDILYTLNVYKWRHDGTIRFFTYRPPPFYDYLGHVVIPFACRQLHHETSLLPYQLATFDFGKAFVGDPNAIPKNQAMKVFLNARTKAQVENLGQVQVDVLWEQGLEIGSRMMTRDGAYWAAQLGCQKIVP